MPRSTRGFSLLEAVVVIAIMAILASAALPLAVKTINQQAEQSTRASAQVAYNAIFGARDHRVSNMIADFGYVLPATGSNLKDMLVKPGAPNNPPVWGAGANYSWGWNGPYWVGSTKTVAGVAVPVDAWGHPFELIKTGANWQVVSAGDDGQFGTADDISYPSVAAAAATCVLTLTVQNNRVTAPSAITGNVTIIDRAGTAALRSQTAGLNFNFAALGSGLSFPVGPGNQVTVNPGPVSMTVTIPIPYAPSLTGVTLTQVVDLLPGQNYSYVFNIY